MKKIVFTICLLYGGLISARNVDSRINRDLLNTFWSAHWISPPKGSLKSYEVCFSNAQNLKDSTIVLSQQQMKWWQDAKFGLFIHYGLYSIPGKNEWTMFNDRIDKDEYAKLASRFKSETFNAEEWVKVAQDAGCSGMLLILMNGIQ